MHGGAWVCGADIAAGDYGATSAFDVVPTVLELVGEWRPGSFSGSSFLDRIGVPAGTR